MCKGSLGTSGSRRGCNGCRGARPPEGSKKGGLYYALLASRCTTMQGGFVLYAKKYSVKPEAQLRITHFLYAK